MKIRTMVGGAAVAGLLASGTAFASDAPEITRAQSLHVFGHTDSLTELDLGEEGLTPGDQFVLTQTLYKGHDRIGDDSIVNTYTDTEGASQCVFTMNLPDGQITGQVLIRAGQKRFVAAVTGGSRRYQNARGQVRVHLLPSGNISFTVQLIP